MRHFVVTAVLATALGLGTVGTASAQHGRFMMNPGFVGVRNPNINNMGAIRAFPTVSSFHGFSHPHAFVPFTGFARFNTFSTFNTLNFNGFNQFNRFGTLANPGFVPSPVSRSFVVPFSPRFGPNPRR